MFQVSNSLFCLVPSLDFISDLGGSPGLWLNGCIICFLSHDMGWITLCYGFWGGIVGLRIWEDWEKTFGVSNGCVHGSFFF